MSRQTIVDKLISQLQAPEPGPDTQERRKNKRQPLRMEVEALVNLKGERHWTTVTLRDISTAGIGLLCSRPFYVGEYMILRLGFSDATQKSKHILCQVKTCRYCGHAMHQMGVEFRDAIVAATTRDFMPEAWFKLISSVQGNK